MLAAKLLAKREESSDGHLPNKLRLQGIIAGNPWTEPRQDNLGEMASL